MVNDLEKRVQQAKDNIDKIKRIMDGWVSPIFERKEGKKVQLCFKEIFFLFDHVISRFMQDNLLNIDDRTERLKKWYDFITKGGEQIHNLIAVSCDNYIIHLPFC